MHFYKSVTKWSKLRITPKIPHNFSVGKISIFQFEIKFLKQVNPRKPFFNPSSIKKHIRKTKFFYIILRLYIHIFINIYRYD